MTIRQRERFVDAGEVGGPVTIPIRPVARPRPPARPNTARATNAGNARLNGVRSTEAAIAVSVAKVAPSPFAADKIARARANWDDDEDETAQAWAAYRAGERSGNAPPYPGGDEWLPPDQQAFSTSTYVAGSQPGTGYIPGHIQTTVTGNSTSILGSPGCPPGFRTIITGPVSEADHQNVTCELIGNETGGLPPFTLDAARAYNRVNGLPEYYYPVRTHGGRLEIAGIGGIAGVGWHVFLIYTAEDGTQYQFYGGKPEFGFSGSSDINSAANIIRSSTGQAQEPIGMLVASSQPLLDSEGNPIGDFAELEESPQTLPDQAGAAGGVYACLDREITEMNNQVIYNVLGPNSSSVVYTALIRCGITPELPDYVTFTTGWGYVIPDEVP